MREDLFTVVHDPFLSVTARYADIVLPATTYLETEDFYRAYGTYWMQYGRAAVPPQGEAWSNLRLAQELARRMGLSDPVFRMSEAELLATLFDGAKGDVAGTDLDALRSGRPMRYAAAGRHRSSGRLRAGSNSIRNNWPRPGLAPMPDWRPDPEEERDAARWPLRLLTAPGYFQAHTAYSGVEFLRRREGPPCCILHPDEAARRGLADGAKVRLFNERGAVGLVLRVSDEVLARGRAGAGAAARRRGAGGHDQPLVLRPLHRYRRRRDVPEHVPRCRGVVRRRRRKIPC